MDKIQDIKSKIQKNKEEKRERLLNSAYDLFHEKGVNKTSIQDIVDKADVAKGTFYLYFKNKEDIRNHLIVEKTTGLFKEGIQSLDFEKYVQFEDKVNAVVDYVIDCLINDVDILQFIERDLSLGFYSNELERIYNEDAEGLYSFFKQGVLENHIDMKNIDITFFMIVEFISSTCYRCLVKKIPCDIEEYKPYLHQGITALIYAK